MSRPALLRRLLVASGCAGAVGCTPAKPEPPATLTSASAAASAASAPASSARASPASAAPAASASAASASAASASAAASAPAAPSASASAAPTAPIPPEPHCYGGPCAERQVCTKAQPQPPPRAMPAPFERCLPYLGRGTFSRARTETQRRASPDVCCYVELARPPLGRPLRVGGRAVAASVRGGAWG